MPSLAAVLRADVRNVTAIIGPQNKLRVKTGTLNGIKKRRMKQWGGLEMVVINTASFVACDRMERSARVGAWVQSQPKDTENT